MNKTVFIPYLVIFNIVIISPKQYFPLFFYVSELQIHQIIQRYNYHPFSPACTENKGEILYKLFRATSKSCTENKEEILYKLFRAASKPYTENKGEILYKLFRATSKPCTENKGENLVQTF
ncbi:hypothetical protein [Tenacibaculum maritimum]|uniref:hypothetical protein n=2 Tax=Tenacibaculum maritimum TaxID=107401 RepID=UPI00387780FD